MKDDLLAVVGLFLLAALAWAAPPLVDRLRAPSPPPPSVVYAQAPGRALLWSPLSTLYPKSLDGRELDPGGRPSRPVGGWPGLLLGNPLDLNAATLEDLEALPRVGPKTAAAILEARATLGRFAAVDDLLQVRGIGAKTLERLRPLVAVGGPSAESASGDGLIRGRHAPGASGSRR